MSFSLPQLGWSALFSQRLTIDELSAAFPARVSAVHRGSLEVLSERGSQRIVAPRQPIDGEEQVHVTVGDWVLVEGQGSLDHPAYSSVTLGLIHGATPHAMVLVHKPGLAEHDFTHLPDVSFPIAPLRPFIDLHERVAGLVAPSKVVAIALNTSLIPTDEEARRVIDQTSAELGLPADDPVRFGGHRLWSEIVPAVEALPWL